MVDATRFSLLFFSQGGAIAYPTPKHNFHNHNLLSKGKGRIKAEFSCQILSEALMFMSVALLNKNNLAAS